MRAILPALFLGSHSPSKQRPYRSAGHWRFLGERGVCAWIVSILPFQNLSGCMCRRTIYAHRKRIPVLLDVLAVDSIALYAMSAPGSLLSPALGQAWP